MPENIPPTGNSGQHSAADDLMKAAYKSAKGMIERVGEGGGAQDSAAPEVDPMQSAYKSARGRVDRVETPAKPTVDEFSEGKPTEGDDIRDSFTRAKAPHVNRPSDGRVMYRKAFYFDGAARFVPVDYLELENDRRFLEIRRQSLMTEDKSRRLIARLGPHFRHFYSPSGSQIDRIVTPTTDTDEAKPETDRQHERRIQFLVRDLTESNPASLFTYNWADYNKATRSIDRDKRPKIVDMLDVEQFVIARLNNYEWKANATRLHMENRIVCPDIIGAPRDTAISAASPQIFIEVVNHHSPSPATWNAYLEHSYEHPLIVLFDFTEHWNYHTRVHKNDTGGGTSAAELRTIYYILEGSLFKNTSPLRLENSEYTSSDFKHAMKIESRNLKRPTQGGASGAEHRPFG